MSEFACSEKSQITRMQLDANVEKSRQIVVFNNKFLLKCVLVTLKTHRQTRSHCGLTQCSDGSITHIGHVILSLQVVAVRQESP